jgi:DNA-binding CsgD family transcriptional regulator
VATLAEANLRSGDAAAAGTLVGPGAPVWERPAYPRAAGLLARAAGLTASAEGRTEVARTQLALALDLFARLELPFETARTELDLARLIAASDHAAAVARASYALKTLRRLGANQEASAAAAFLRSLGETPGPGPRDRATLSHREEEVLGLLVHGLSNPEIADRMFLSSRTVAHHVSSILRKLDLHSRAEAAAFAVRQATQP